MTRVRLDAVHEHDVGAVIGAWERTHVGDVVERDVVCRSARRTGDTLDEEVHLLDVGVRRRLPLGVHGVAVLIDDGSGER